MGVRADSPAEKLEVLDPTAEEVGLKLLEWGGADVAIEFFGSYPALLEAIRSVQVAGWVVAGFYQGAALRFRESSPSLRGTADVRYPETCRKGFS